MAEVSTAVECLQLGALDYISKPVLINEVRSRVQMALEKRELVSQNRFYQQHLESRVRELDRRDGQSLIKGVQMLAHALEAKDAYTSGHSARVSRAYRPSRTPDEAMDELRRCAGMHFDPEVVDAFQAAFPDPAALPLPV